MIKSIKTIMRQDKERYTVPHRVQDVIPIQTIWQDGIFRVGNKFSKTYRFTDINYKVASREDQESMFLTYSELLNSLDSAATTKLTICNRRQSHANFEQSVLMAMRGDGLYKYRQEYNQMLIDKATGANGILQEKFVTISIYKRDVDDARAYFARIGADLTARFAALGSKCVELDAADRLRILHDFYRAGEEENFHFDMADTARKGHDFKDYICPDAMEKHSDYLKLGDRYCRVLFLKDYASYIKDDFVTVLTDLTRSMMPKNDPAVQAAIDALTAKAETGEVIHTEDMKILPCVGCNACWLKTPGVCAIRDDYEAILRALLRYDAAIFLAGTALGFLDHRAKNIVDRTLPLGTMYSRRGSSLSLKTRNSRSSKSPRSRRATASLSPAPCFCWRPLTAVTAMT